MCDAAARAVVTLGPPLVDIDALNRLSAGPTQLLCELVWLSIIDFLDEGGRLR